MKALFLLLAIPLMAFQPTHKFYVSHYLCAYKPKKESLQVSAKIFTDDLEKALKHFHHDTEIRLPARDSLQNSDSLVEAYFRYHFYLKKDNKAVLWDWVGKEYNNDVTWVYMEQLNLKRAELREHTIHCTALINQFDQQKNIMDLRFGRQKKTEILTKRSTDVQLID